MNKNNNYTVIDGPIHNKYHHDIQGCIQKFRLGGGGGGQIEAIEHFRGFLSYQQETILNIWNRKPHRISI